MKAISNAFKGVTYHNPQLGESLYELCRRATSRHISGPDEILNQQVVYMINSEMHTPYAAKDACTCLKRRLQMDNPQKQYLAIILTSKVLQDCHAALGIYQGELLQEIAYILRTVRSSGPASARTRQVAMDVLRHFGSAGGDAYRVARQQGGGTHAPQYTVAATQNRDPAAVAAERESLLDEIKRMCEQASASTEILNELILNKRDSQSGDGGVDDGAGLRRELLADAKELRKLFDMYMNQLAALTGSDAEEAMKCALEAVDQLDNALTLEKDVDAELKDLEAKGQLPPLAAAADQPAAAAPATAAPAAPDAAAAKMQSMNLIDLDDEPTPAAAPAAAAALDPFAVAAGGPSAAAAAGPADPFAPAPAAAADPFAALAAAPVSAGFPANGFGTAATPAGAGFDGPVQPFPPLGDSTQQPGLAAAAAADPFADASPQWAAQAAAVPATTMGTDTPANGGFDALAAAVAGSAQQQQQQPPSSGPPSSGPPSVGTGGGMSGGGFMPQQQQQQGYGGAATFAPPGIPGYGMPGPYGQMIPPQLTGQMGPYGMGPYAGMTGQMQMQMPGGVGGYYMPQQTGMQGYTGTNAYGSPYTGAAAAGSAAAGPYGTQPAAAAAAVNPYGMGSAAAAGGGGSSPYPSLLTQQTSLQQREQQQQQQEAPQPFSTSSAPAAAPAAATSMGLSPSNPFATVAPAAGGTPNPFGAVAAGTTGNVDAEWDKFFKQ